MIKQICKFFITKHALCLVRFALVQSCCLLRNIFKQPENEFYQTMIHSLAELLNNQNQEKDYKK